MLWKTVVIRSKMVDLYETTAIDGKTGRARDSGRYMVTHLHAF
jgi:hypothetical protein